MQPTVGCRPCVLTDGVVVQIDTLNRELVARLGKRLFRFDVPPDCEIRLRGERIKLRLVLPDDPVRVSYVESRGALVARAIEIQTAPAAPSP